MTFFCKMYYLVSPHPPIPPLSFFKAKNQTFYLTIVSSKSQTGTYIKRKELTRKKFIFSALQYPNLICMQSSVAVVTTLQRHRYSLVWKVFSCSQNTVSYSQCVKFTKVFKMPQCINFTKVPRSISYYLKKGVIYRKGCSSESGNETSLVAIKVSLFHFSSDITWV